MKKNKYLKVKFAHDCTPCQDCGEPFCNSCNLHYFECQCPGPHQDDEYNYKWYENELYAKKIIPKFHSQ